MNLPLPTMLATGEVDLAVYRWGEHSGGPPVVLVHGYPDNAGVWSATAEALAVRHPVFAYDVRGAGRSSRPAATRAYALERLVADLRAVLDATSPDAPVHLVGHDWGSIQAWEAVTAGGLDGRIASFTSISGPCLDHVGDWIQRRRRSPAPGDRAALRRQLGRSWYILFFHLPGVAPAMWRAAGRRLWPQWLARVEAVRDAAANPTQAADGEYGVKLYRANVRQRMRRPRPRFTGLPVQLLVPRRDHYVSPALWDELPRWAPNLERHDVDAGHWLPLSHPQWLADRVLDFIAARSAGGPSSQRASA